MLYCDECSKGPREVRLQSKREPGFHVLSVCAACAAHILNMRRPWTVFDVDQEVIDRLRDRLNDRDPDIIGALLIIDNYMSPAVPPTTEQTKQAA